MSGCGLSHLLRMAARSVGCSFERQNPRDVENGTFKGHKLKVTSSGRSVKE